MLKVGASNETHYQSGPGKECSNRTAAPAGIDRRPAHFSAGICICHSVFVRRDYQCPRYLAARRNMVARFRGKERFRTYGCPARSGCGIGRADDVGPKLPMPATRRPRVKARNLGRSRCAPVGPSALSSKINKDSPALHLPAGN